MRYRRFDFEKKTPFFRPPKYTGITLSLLSVFVLVSMLAVWEKMANVPKLPVINVLAWENTRLPLENAGSIYQNETSCLVHITYLPFSDLSSLPSLNNKTNQHPWDLILLPETDAIRPFLLENKYEQRGIVAYYKGKDDPRGEIFKPKQPIPLLSLVERAKQEDKEVHSFLRFLKAPTKGQVEFAINGWTGVNEDHWEVSPQLKIYAIQSSKPWINHLAEQFAQNEGLELSVSYLDMRSLQTSLKILTKANNKDYLPDLIGFPANDSKPAWLDPYFSEVHYSTDINSGAFSFYIRKQSPLLKTVQKFLVVLRENQ